MTDRSHRAYRGLRLGGLAGLALALAGQPAAAETLETALARAYAGNPTLNSQRAGQRATDENVARALSGYRPTVSGTAAIGVQNTSGAQGGVRISQTIVPGSAGLTVNQTLFNGFLTDNQTRQAESQVLGGRESLRNVEMTILFNAAQAYMNVLADTATLELNRNNVEVLEEQLRQTRDRFNVGEVTRTDVAQAEARLAGARSQVSLAESNLRTSIATYRQVVGVEPRQLAPGRPLDRFVPGNLTAAIDIGLREHPQVISALHAVDVAEAQVKIAEAALYPTVSVSGTVQKLFDQQFAHTELFEGAVTARLSVPLYQGGVEYAAIRQAKEQVGQTRIQVETFRDQVRAAIVTAWGGLEAAKARVIAQQAQVQANEVALNGVREEARVGQRTTLDVLNAQQELLSARVNLIAAQRDRVVSSYQVVQSIGRLTTAFINVPVAQYSAKLHFDQVKDLWYGVRTPDGR
ncbi:type I secretion outer membrane protein, TolC family [Methylobacterium sp. 4-46]|uniref:TolC family outer membrane protein n=1 Tax=unclassified Methylobacterium TaxID=2615210 RepID=UPI000152CD54|nr:MULTISPECIES: TolC family outer membrane protein [Methylobacterium]ACA20165.1 type I secretion outer membrane protein, TolC family [Methylobacterium sp. 4-46]WFT79344.1 TolC family outer membrane protein [Methylobacterium nodulans]